MKVLLINGSPHEKGCTYTALSLIAKELNDAGVDTEILHVGGKPVGGCIGCGAVPQAMAACLAVWSTRPSRRPKPPMASCSAARCTMHPHPAT